MDDRTAMAISHWAPRFTTNGVTAGDFERITSGLEQWADWCGAWSAVAAEHEKLGRDALAARRELSAGQHLSQAAVYYHFAKFLFVDDLSQMRAAHLAAVRCLNDALPYLDPPGRRIEIPFEGAHMVGVLRQHRSRPSQQARHGLGARGDQKHAEVHALRDGKAAAAAIGLHDLCHDEVGEHVIAGIALPLFDLLGDVRVQRDHRPHRDVVHHSHTRL